MLTCALVCMLWDNLTGTGRSIVYCRGRVVYEMEATPVASPWPSVGQRGCRCCLRARSPAPQRSGLPTRPAGPPHLCGCWGTASGTQQTSCTLGLLREQLGVPWPTTLGLGTETEQPAAKLCMKESRNSTCPWQDMTPLVRVMQR